MEFRITRFARTTHGGSLKAFCDVTLDETVLIKGIRVVEGERGPFVSMPRQQSRNGKWYDTVVLLTPEARKHLTERVLEAARLHEIISARMDHSP